MTLENEEKILLTLTDLQKQVAYQTQLLETVVSNSDEMKNRKQNFDPKKQIEEIQKILPKGIDLEKIFNLVQNKE